MARRPRPAPRFEPTMSKPVAPGLRPTCSRAEGLRAHHCQRASDGLPSGHLMIRQRHSPDKNCERAVTRCRKTSPAASALLQSCTPHPRRCFRAAPHILGAASALHPSVTSASNPSWKTRRTPTSHRGAASPCGRQTRIRNRCRVDNPSASYSNFSRRRLPYPSTHSS